MKFYDRVDELDIIGRANRVAVLGRRRVGKTRLLQEAMEDDIIYLFFYGDATEAFIVEKWIDSLKKRVDYVPPLNRVTDVLEYIFRNLEQPLVIDEIQNSVKKFPHFISLLQQLLDEFKGRKVAVTGSLISVMKRLVEDYKSPVFGRFDFIIKLRELDFKTVLEIMSDLGYDRQEALKYYSVFGGIPKYYELIETMKPKRFHDFINQMFFKYPRPLFNEIYVMLKEEIGKEYSSYFGILHSIAQRGITFGTIASAMNMASNSLSKYLSALTKDYELVRKEQPLSKKKKKTHYVINSNIIDFWFNYCFSHRDLLETGNDELVYKRFLDRFPTWYGFKFETMVISLLPDFLKRKGIDFDIIGKDWGSGYEFDFTVESEGPVSGQTINRIYIGEIKAGDLNVYAEAAKIDAITQRETFYRDKSISKIFIADKFSRKIEDENVMLVGVEEFFDIA